MTDIPDAALRWALAHDDDPALRVHVERTRPDIDWTPEPHPWCERHCTTPDTCDCPEPITIGKHIELGCE